jgi:hypothetical protein
VHLDHPNKINSKGYYTNKSDYSPSRYNDNMNSSIEIDDNEVSKLQGTQDTFVTLEDQLKSASKKRNAVSTIKSHYK